MAPEQSKNSTSGSKPAQQFGLPLSSIESASQLLQELRAEQSRFAREKELVRQEHLKNAGGYVDQLDQLEVKLGLAKVEQTELARTFEAAQKIAVELRSSTGQASEHAERLSELEMLVQQKKTEVNECQGQIAQLLDRPGVTEERERRLAQRRLTTTQSSVDHFCKKFGQELKNVLIEVSNFNQSYLTAIQEVKHLAEEYLCVLMKSPKILADSESGIALNARAAFVSATISTLDTSPEIDSAEKSVLSFVRELREIKLGPFWKNREERKIRTEICQIALNPDQDWSVKQAFDSWRYAVSTVRQMTNERITIRTTESHWSDLCVAVTDRFNGLRAYEREFGDRARFDRARAAQIIREQLVDYRHGDCVKEDLKSFLRELKVPGVDDGRELDRKTFKVALDTVLMTIFPSINWAFA